MGFKEQYEDYWHRRNKQPVKKESSANAPGELLETVEHIVDKQSAIVLDAGSGPGDLQQIAWADHTVVYGCDISETACREAAKRGMVAVCADLNSGHLPYQNESIETITCIEVIEHVPDPQHLLKELFRILKNNGQLVLTTPNIRYVRHIGKLVFEGVFPHTTTDDFIWGGGHLHYFTVKDLIGLIKQAGFDHITIHINRNQFQRSIKRRILYRLLGHRLFAEWFCSGIIAEVKK